jgi:hypothetical protein
MLLIRWIHQILLQLGTFFYFQERKMYSRFGTKMPQSDKETKACSSYPQTTKIEFLLLLLLMTLLSTRLLQVVVGVCHPSSPSLAITHHHPPSNKKLNDEHRLAH